MNFEDDVITRLTRLETKVDSIERKHKEDRAMMRTLGGAVVMSLGAVISIVIAHFI